MTRTGIFVALTLACCAAELRAQMAYPYISPPGIGSRGGPMARRSAVYAPTYSTTMYATPTSGTVVTTPTVIDGSTVITQPASPIIVGGTIITPSYTPSTIIGTSGTPTIIGGTIVSPFSSTPTITTSGTIISPVSYSPVITTSSGTYFTRVRGGRTTAPVAGTYSSPGVIYIR